MIGVEKDLREMWEWLIILQRENLKKEELINDLNSKLASKPLF